MNRKNFLRTIGLTAAGTQIKPGKAISQSSFSSLHHIQTFNMQGATIKVPDFTNGAWKTNKRGMDVSLQHGGTTNLV